MCKKIEGIPVSAGYAYAKVYRFQNPDMLVKRFYVADTARELARLDVAIEKTKTQIENIRHQAEESLMKEAEVFDAHMLMLFDPEILHQVKENIVLEHLNAEAAFLDISDNYIVQLTSLEKSNYMRERAVDIKDVRNRVLANLLDISLPDLAVIDEEVILIADELTPSITVQLNKAYVKAFITETGGPSSHAAIMAHTLKIPAIVGAKDVLTEVKDGDWLAFDGVKGLAWVNPTPTELTTFNLASEAFVQKENEWKKHKDVPSFTADGKKITIAGNIAHPEESNVVRENGGEGVGLYRTEFLYMDAKGLPSEEEQFAAYQDVLVKQGNDNVTIRTMDIGGDKKAAGLNLPVEMNPFLGYRAIRISLKQDNIFRTQLRALLRASVYGNLQIMFPMIATLEEFRVAKAIFIEEKHKLLAEGIAVADNIPLGMMIETPAAAVLADQFAKEVDFFSIGSNDLIQYTMAADRLNETVAYLYQPYHPAILRLIQAVIDAAHKESKWVGMCGEMAADPLAIPLLVGMGLDEFSMSASSILKTRALISKLDPANLQDLVDKALHTATTSTEVKSLVLAWLDEE